MNEVTTPPKLSPASSVIQTLCKSSSIETTTSTRLYGLENDWKGELWDEKLESLPAIQSSFVEDAIATASLGTFFTFLLLLPFFLYSVFALLSNSLSAKPMGRPNSVCILVYCDIAGRTMARLDSL